MNDDKQCVIRTADKPLPNAEISAHHPRSAFYGRGWYSRCFNAAHKEDIKMMKNKDFFRELVASAPEHAEKPQPILACIDFSNATAGVIGETATLACATKANVELVYV